MKKVINVSVVVTWLGVVGRVKWIIFLTLFSTPVPVTGWSLSSSKLSSDEYSIITFRSTLPPGLGTGFFPLPMAKGFPPVFFLAVCFVWAIRESLPHSCKVLGLCQAGRALQFYVETSITWSASHGTLFGISGQCLKCLSRWPRIVECTAFTFSLDNLTRAFTAVHSI